jgi:hypothetical protein
MWPIGHGFKFELVGPPSIEASLGAATKKFAIGCSAFPEELQVTSKRLQRLLLKAVTILKTLLPSALLPSCDVHQRFKAFSSHCRTRNNNDRRNEQWHGQIYTKEAGTPSYDFIAFVTQSFRRSKRKNAFRFFEG